MVMCFAQNDLYPAASSPRELRGNITATTSSVAIQDNSNPLTSSTKARPMIEYLQASLSPVLGPRCKFPRLLFLP